MGKAQTLEELLDIDDEDEFDEAEFMEKVKACTTWEEVLKTYGEQNKQKDVPQPREIKNLLTNPRRQNLLARKALVGHLGDEISLEAAIGDEISYKAIIRGGGLKELSKIL